MTFAEFHKRLCEHFACHGDFTGFLVNQNFRTINVNNLDKDKLKQVPNDVAKRTEFQKKIANNKNHTCVHDAEIFKNWDKLRLSGFRLSEMKEHIELMLYEVTFHKEESESLKEIIEDLRAMLQVKYMYSQYHKTRKLWHFCTALSVSTNYYKIPKTLLKFS